MGRAGDVAKLEARTVLGRWTLGEILSTRPPSTVVSLKAADTVRLALTKLARHNITSAPVLSDNEEEYIGFVSVADIVRAFVRGVQPGLLRNIPGKSELAAAGEELLDKMVTTVVPGDYDGKLVYKAHVNANLNDVIRNGFLGEHEGGCVSHRLAVFDLDGGADDMSLHINGVLSQSDVMQWLWRRAHVNGELEKLAVTTVAELSLTDRAVQTVASTTSALVAFADMIAKGVSAFAVVAPMGHEKKPGTLMGVITASDLRGLTDFGSLALPVAEFLATKLSRDAVYNPSRNSYDEGVLPRVLAGVRLTTDQEDVFDQKYIYAICCRPESKLSHVLNAMVTHRVHHVFVIDRAETPLSCITPTDILRLVSSGDDDDA